MPVKSFPVTAGASDGFDSGGGDAWDITSPLFRLGNPGTEATTEANPFLCFNGITIPRHSKIESAYLYIKAYTSLSGTTIIHNIKGEDVDNAVAPTGNIDYWAKTRTTAVVSWTVPAWAAGTWYYSADIKSIVQEIIERVGWAKGNAMQFFIEFASAPASTERRGSTYEDTGYSPQLVVDWWEPGAQPAMHSVSAWV